MIGGETTTQGSVASFTCEDGYDLVGPINRVCSAVTGKWSGEDSKCEEKPSGAEQQEAAGTKDLIGKIAEHMPPLCKDAKNGVCFFNSAVGPNTLDYNEAKKFCRVRNAKIASLAQLQHAWSAGLHSCNFGWLRDATVRMPVSNRKELSDEAGNKCGPDVAIRQVNPRPAHEEKYGVFCYRYDETKDLTDAQMQKVLRDHKAKMALEHAEKLAAAKAQDGGNALDPVVDGSENATSTAEYEAANSASMAKNGSISSAAKSGNSTAMAKAVKEDIMGKKEATDSAVALLEIASAQRRHLLSTISNLGNSKSRLGERRLQRLASLRSKMVLLQEALRITANNTNTNSTGKDKKICSARGCS
jgi:hypothetical protein